MDARSTRRWPPHYESKLRELWAEGYSNSHMARELNKLEGHATITPNAVAGKADRLGLCKRNTRGAFRKYTTKAGGPSRYFKFDSNVSGTKDIWRPGVDPKPPILSRNDKGG